MDKKTSFEQWIDENNEVLAKSVLEMGLTSLSFTAISRIMVLLDLVYNAGYDSAIKDQAKEVHG